MSAVERHEMMAATMLTGLRGAVAAIALFAAATPAAAQDKVLGLLALPEVFGKGPCHLFDPAAILLRPAPGATEHLGSIQVDQHWSFAPHGGCEGLQVSVHHDGRRAELPTLEYANESPAAIVLAEQGGWFKIRLATGAGWLQASPRDRFMPLADLFSEYPTLTTLNEAFTGSLLEAPGGTATEVKPALTRGLPVRVLDVRSVGDRQWLQVAVMSHSICDADRSGPPDVEGIGWMPAHTTAGEPTVWFSSRGC